jgi:Fanconi anemia group M protein
LKCQEKSKKTDLQRYSRQAKNLTTNKLSKKTLIEIQNRIRKNLGKRGGVLFNGLSIVSAMIKLSHFRDMLTSQGVDVAKKYISKLEEDRSRAAKRIKKHVLYLEIKEDIEEIKEPHPKLIVTKEIIKKHIKEKENARIMIFAEYRDTVDMLLAELKTVNNVKPVRFIGQNQKGGEKGMSQIEQKQTLDAFQKGEYNVLLSTSIGEEGIDIPATSLVLFYEPVPSAIRHIQRKGRTARNGLPGEVIILIIKESRDEGYYWSSTKKEKTMYTHVYRLKNRLEGKKIEKKNIKRQSKIEDFSFIL